MNITEHQAFRNCEGKLLSSLIGGSTLYGLNNEDSDVDYRGLFFASDKKYVSGFETIGSIVQTGENDSCYYEIAHFLRLLRKSNSQVLEILFAPSDALILTSPIFEELRENRFNLIDSGMLKASLLGYVFSEIKIATGARSGQLGGKRKQAVETYGYSYKNMVQILRLCEVGVHFFREGNYMVRVKDFDPEKYELLMRIKNHPEDFTCDQLKAMVDVDFANLKHIMDESKISFKFDYDYAADLILRTRKIYE